MLSSKQHITKYRLELLISIVCKNVLLDNVNHCEVIIIVIKHAILNKKKKTSERYWAKHENQIIYS